MKFKHSKPLWLDQRQLAGPPHRRVDGGFVSTWEAGDGGAKTIAKFSLCVCIGPTRWHKFFGFFSFSLVSRHPN